MYLLCLYVVCVIYVDQSSKKMLIFSCYWEKAINSKYRNWDYSCMIRKITLFYCFKSVFIDN